MNLPQRYIDIRRYVEGLQFSGILEGHKSKLTFLNTEKYWCSHIVLFNERGMTYNEKFERIPKVESDLFGIYYLKSKDRVWIKASLPVQSRSTMIMINNGLVDVLRKKGFQVLIDQRQSFFSGKGYVKVLIDDHHNEDDIYNLYEFFRKYQKDEKLLKALY